jgi:hypothetical protein
VRQIAVQAPGDDVLGPDIVMVGHHKMRQSGLRLRAPIDTVSLQLGQLPLNPIWSELGENVELPPARGIRTPIGQVDDLTLFDPVDRRVRLIDEAPQPLGQPVIAPGLATITVHTLLDHNPVAVIGDNETVEVEVEPVLDRRAVDLGDEATCCGEPRAVDTDPVADRDELMRRLARMLAAPAANMDAELA